MKRFLSALCAALIMLASGGAGLAKDAVPNTDPAAEPRVKRLAEELRCLVCQNQSLADSNADLAVDLRQQIREQMNAGKSDAQIREFMVQRYGDFVLYRPPFNATTAVLWLGPFILLVAGVLALFAYLARRRRKAVDTALTDEQRARAEALLAGRAQDSR
jgi:cytochrome c-type biogenesis protein CcmH